MRRLLPVILLCFIGILSSCGGGKGGTSTPAPTPTPTLIPTPTPMPTPVPTPAPTRVRLQVRWGARSRIELSGPASALSVEFQVGPTLLRANRAARTDSYTELVESLTTLPPGIHTCTATFYAEPNQGGSVVALGTGALTLEPDGTLTGSFTLVGTVQSVVVLPRQSLLPAERLAVLTQVTNPVGETLALTPGSVFLRLPESASETFAAITSDHLLLGIAPGTVQIQASVDGTVSPTETVLVKTPISIAVTPSVVTVTLEETKTFSATVAGLADTAVVWSVTEGAAGGSITSAGLYTAPKTPGTFHVVATSAAQATLTATATITVTAGSGSITIQ